MLRLAAKLCSAALLPPSMMALKQATTTTTTTADDDDSSNSSTTESTTESSSSSDLQLRSLLAHLFTVTLQQQIDAHRTEEQYSSLTGIYLFHIVSPRWSSPLFWSKCAL